ncbi:AI-2E family transporter [Rheinheimera tangshanensis]|jgi:predicted PurR-regulated permease PerM|uniref:AI-2E family transporter n=1 Tax=Rheinheimera tangshanensis TaxID=400153 RepID=A0A5C8LZ56_9GAMM|nr:AI-2E family transporter [Rheinheimera tangshanensis]TXK81495.1 AI-2E family transporter [Rheinheimera tangshanensis]GGM57555.1 AI-2E family transporter [Rheinheimera tangshanensis]
MLAKLEERFFLIMLVVVSLAFGLVLEPFWGCIFWACAITVIFYPVQQKILRLIGDKPNRAALITLLLCVLIVILPVLAIGAAFIQEGVAFYDKIEKGEINPDGFIESIRQAFPVVTEFLARFGIQTDGVREKLSSGAVEASRLLAKEALSIGQNTFGFILSLCLMLYLTFFLLREGHHLVELMVRALPLGDQRERLLFSKFAEVTRATVKGNLVVAIVQGALGGLIFWLLGLPAPILWGVVMAFLSLLPAVGAALVWLPVSLYWYATGDWVIATILVAYGALVIGLADNILRPLLVGRDTKLPDYLVLFSTLGGITLMGINGFVLGPMVAALFLVFWQIFIDEFQRPHKPESSG